MILKARSLLCVLRLMIMCRQIYSIYIYSTGEHILYQFTNYQFTNVVALLVCATLLLSFFQSHDSIFLSSFALAHVSLSTFARFCVQIGSNVRWCSQAISNSGDANRRPISRFRLRTAQSYGTQSFTSPTTNSSIRLPSPIPPLSSTRRRYPVGRRRLRLPHSCMHATLPKPTTSLSTQPVQSPTTRLPKQIAAPAPHWGKNQPLTTPPAGDGAAGTRGRASTGTGPDHAQKPSRLRPPLHARHPFLSHLGRWPRGPVTPRAPSSSRLPSPPPMTRPRTRRCRRHTAGGAYCGGGKARPRPGQPAAMTASSTNSMPSLTIAAHLRAPSAARLPPTRSPTGPPRTTLQRFGSWGRTTHICLSSLLAPKIATRFAYSVREGFSTIHHLFGVWVRVWVHRWRQHYVNPILYWACKLWSFPFFYFFAQHGPLFSWTFGLSTHTLLDVNLVYAYICVCAN